MTSIRFMIVLNTVQFNLGFTIDAARDKLYNPKGFADTASRLAHWLERYEILINAEREQQAIDKKAKKLKRKRVNKYIGIYIYTYIFFFNI